MLRTSACVIFLSFSWTAFAQAQPPAPTDHPGAQQLTLQALGEMIRSASTFHDMVAKMNVTESMGPDQHALGADGRYHHTLQRTAATVGAGAGAGAAIGEMTHSANGTMIGAIVGSAGGLVVDQVIRHREEVREKAVNAPAGNSEPRPLQRRSE